MNADLVEAMVLTMKVALTKMSSRPVTLPLPQHFQTIANTVETVAPVVWGCLPAETVEADGCGT